MKGKHLPFLILPIFIFSFFLVNPLGVKGAVENEVVQQEEGWVDSSSCVANSCGTTEGTKTQTYYSLVCEKTCPTLEFSASEEYLVSEGYYMSCPAHYNVDPQDESKCVKTYTKYASKVLSCGRHCDWVCPTSDSAYIYDSYFWGSCSREFTSTVDRVYVDPVYATKTYGSVSVKYLLDTEAEVCSRPSADDVITGCRNAWAKEYYNTQMPVTASLIETDTCELVPTDTKEVECEAEVVACPIVEEDEPEVLGTTDTVVTPTVVLAETGSSSNAFVYIIQAILVLATLVSGTVFVKKYII